MRRHIKLAALREDVEKVLIEATACSKDSLVPINDLEVAELRIGIASQLLKLKLHRQVLHCIA